MKVTVVISSYNYEKFAVECIRSVVEQTYQNIEIVFVDDGSIDNTISVIKDLSFDKLKIVQKINGGQLSAFNAAIPHITGDLVFFLDADDVYTPDYLEKTIEFYKNNADADFVFCGINYFGNTSISNVTRETKSYGFTLCRAWFLRHWIGEPTSAVSMRKNVLDKILPLELDSDWRVRADDCLVWGASLVGAKKYFFGGAAIKYRVHGSNNFFGKSFNADYCFKRSLAINRMFNMILRKNHINITSDLLLKEFTSNPEKSINVLFDYLIMSLMLETSILIKTRSVLQLLKRFFIRRPASFC